MVEQPTQFDPLVDQVPSRYVVGIDLGTTNSAVTYVDTTETPWHIRIFSIPQLVAAGDVDARETLPSFHYEPVRVEAEADTLRLPWQPQPAPYAVGTFARDDGAKTSGRVIASAKSWLCHSGVDRTAKLLPWHGAADVDRLSPVQVSARYLRHIREAWDAAFRKEPLADQDIVLTLPASFDEVARELTVQAAALADLPRVVLIEEPQAAFYAWVYKHADDWHQRVSAGQKILVCDIGGGTSDFTLIRVRRSKLDDDEGGKVQFHRVAVGNHLILGGDNLDLALARHIERKLAAEATLQPRQWDVLVSSCRRVKEQLLGQDALERQTVNLPGSGSKLIGGGLQVEVAREEVRELLVDGFLPRVALTDKPQQRQSGFQEFGLPYATDAAITRYLAAFLSAHRDSADEDEPSPKDRDPARPDVVLFNGGFFASSDLRSRLLEVLASWFPGADDWSPVVLDNDRLDMAVARGAAYYGMVRRGEGVRIAASLARSYYISVADDQGDAVAVCLVPGNAEPGQDIELVQPTFKLTISQPAEFPLYVSSTRLADQPGEVLPIDPEQMTPMPPIRTVLKASRRRETGDVSVNLHVRLTEIGTIDLWCKEVGTDRSWRLQFDIRSTTQTDAEVHDAAGEAEGFVDEQTWQDCHRVISGVFSGEDKPSGVVKQLAKALDVDRSQWPMSLLRRIWEALMELESGRRRSATHEARWLNLMGYALRPGYGLAVDDWRVTESWRTVRGKLVHHTPAVQSESHILWRRLAGGLSAGQQMAIAEPLLASVRGLHRRFTTGKAASASLRPEDSTEVWRLLGSLELLSVTRKVELGSMLVDLLPRRKLGNVREPMVWALGRLGQRTPVYGPLNTIVPEDHARKWLDAIMSRDKPEPIDHLAVMQMARKTDDRYRDLAGTPRSKVAQWQVANDAPEHFIKLVSEGGSLDDQEQGKLFGEALPKGLRIQ